MGWYVVPHTSFTIGCYGTCDMVFCQITVGAGSPEMGTSRRSLFPATTTMVSGVRPGQSRWILGGSGVGAGNNEIGQRGETARAMAREEPGWGIGTAGSP